MKTSEELLRDIVDAGCNSYDSDGDEMCFYCLGDLDYHSSDCPYVAAKKFLEVGSSKIGK